MIYKQHKWVNKNKDNHPFNRCVHCGVNLVLMPHPIRYIYYYDGILKYLRKKPVCKPNINNYESHSRE